MFIVQSTEPWVASLRSQSRDKNLYLISHPVITRKVVMKQLRSYTTGPWVYVTALALTRSKFTLHVTHTNITRFSANNIATTIQSPAITFSYQGMPQQRTSDHLIRFLLNNR